VKDWNNFCVRGKEALRGDENQAYTSTKSLQLAVISDSGTERNWEGAVRVGDAGKQKKRRCCTRSILVIGWGARGGKEDCWRENLLDKIEPRKTCC